MEKEHKKLLNLLDNVKQIEFVAESLSFLNFGKVDIVEGTFTNFISEFSERNRNLIHSIIFTCTNNFRLGAVSYNEEDDVVDIAGSELLIIFALRDIIENVEVLSWLKLNNNKWLNNTTKMNNENDFLAFIGDVLKSKDDEIHKSFLRKLSGKENMKSYKVTKSYKQNLELELEKRYGNINLSNDFNYIEDTKNKLHNYIHKNGLKYINIRGISYEEFLEEYLNRLLFIFKFYFKISFLLDGTCVASSDYIDYLDYGIEPPKDCQYWVAPIFNKYILNQFSETEKKWIESNNTYNMRFTFLDNNHSEE